MSDKNSLSVVALGYFDSVHVGHLKVIDRAKSLADNLNSKLVVVTFADNLRAAVGNGTEKVVYTKEEREEIYYSLGVDEVFFAPTDKRFLSQSKDEFLSFLNEKYLIKGYVTGEDYRFGKSGEGSISDLTKYAIEHSQQHEIVPIEKDGEEKISTTLVKEYIKDGKVKKVKELLKRAYSITGKVYEDRKVGREMGFPTINVKPNAQKESLKSGVYAGSVNINGKFYRAVVNYGARPTFNLDGQVVEAHIVDFSGNLYGQNVTISFHEFIRDIIKFDNADELKERLEKDLKRVKEIEYD